MSAPPRAAEIVRASAPLREISREPSVRLGRWPTPVARVPLDGGQELLVKRDDLSGHGRGGVKTRKIEQLVSKLDDESYDTLVTAVGNVTNLVHDLVPVLVAHHIAWEIVVNDDPPLPSAERARIFGDVGGVRLLGPSRGVAAIVQAAALRRTRRSGRRAFLALPSLAHPTAVIATARGFLEMVGQVEGMDVPPLQTVFITASSGTSLAGLLLAEHLLRLGGHDPIEVIGVQVYPGPIRHVVRGLIRWTEHRLGVGRHLPSGSVTLDDSRLGGGFGRFPPGLADICLRVRDETGVAIDPVFGGKTWSVMETHLARGRATGSTLYWHCGYTPDWRHLGCPVTSGPR